MNRKWTFGTGIILAAIAASALFGFRARPPAAPPSTFSVIDVPRMAYRGELIGRRIRVVLRFPLHFSDDRSTATYSPSVNGTASKTVEFHFRNAVNYSPDVVEGTVQELRLDAIDRINRVPGIAVMVDCVPD